MKAANILNALTEEQKFQWEKDGYLILKGALSSEEVEGLTVAVNYFYEKYLQEQIPNNSRDRETASLFPPQWINSWDQENCDLEKLTFRRWNIVEDEHLFLDLIDHSTTFPIIVDLLDVYIQMSMSELIVMPSKGKEIPYIHLDGGEALEKIRVSEDSLPLSIKLEYFLTDINASDSGNLTVVPGSHNRKFQTDHINHSGIDLSEAIQLHVNAGDVAIFPHSLWHGVSANKSTQTRKTLLYTYNHQCFRPYDYEKPSFKLLSNCTSRQRRLLGDISDWYWRAGCYYHSHPNQRQSILM